MREKMLKVADELRKKGDKFVAAAIKVRAETRGHINGAYLRIHGEVLRDIARILDEVLEKDKVPKEQK